MAGANVARGPAPPYESAWHHIAWKLLEIFPSLKFSRDGIHDQIDLNLAEAKLRYPGNQRQWHKWRAELQFWEKIVGTKEGFPGIEPCPTWPPAEAAYAPAALAARFAPPAYHDAVPRGRDQRRRESGGSEREREQDRYQGRDQSWEHERQR